MAFQGGTHGSDPRAKQPPFDQILNDDELPDNPLANQPMSIVTDVDQARSMFRHIYSDASVFEPAPGLPFHWQMRRVAADGVTCQVGDFQNAFTFSVEGLDNRFGLVLARTGHSAGDLRRARFEIILGRHGALISPGTPGVIETSSKYGTLNINIDAQALRKHLQGLTGRSVRGPLRFDVPIDLRSPAGATVYRIAIAFTIEVGRANASPLLISALRDALLTSILTCVQHNRSDCLNPRPTRLTPGYLRKAEEFMTEHLDEPITLISIAEEIGVSARALQVAFRAHRSYSPMQFLKERRLELAHQRLLEAAPGTTVAAIAMAAGMDHLGRFSLEYKKRFGESPSETLRRTFRQS